MLPRVKNTVWYFEFVVDSSRGQLPYDTGTNYGFLLMCLLVGQEDGYIIYILKLTYNVMHNQHKLYISDKQDMKNRSTYNCTLLINRT